MYKKDRKLHATTERSDGPSEVNLYQPRLAHIMVSRAMGIIEDLSSSKSKPQEETPNSS